jgi:hypothetical protein
MSKLHKPDDVLDGVRSPADRKHLRAVLACVEEMREAEAAFRAQQAQRREKLQGVATECLAAVTGAHLYREAGACACKTEDAASNTKPVSSRPENRTGCMVLVPSWPKETRLAMPVMRGQRAIAPSVRDGANGVCWSGSRLAGRRHEASLKLG